MSSLLNPEAPEFYPHLDATTKDTYVHVNKSIRSSNQMPSGYSHELYRTYTEFNVVTSKLGENVILESNNIIVTELPAVKLRVNDNDSNTEKVVHANDSLLDRLNVTIDTVKGVNKPNQKFIQGVNRPNISSWNNGPVIEKIQIGSATFIGAKNIPRPQINFKDTIDNSENFWVPKISDKPNNIKPLVLNIIYNEDGKAVGYEHPYKVELELYHPPAEFLDSDQSPPEPPKSLASTKLMYIETEAQVDTLVTHLTQVKQFAVDVEHHSYRTYQGITCLIQITTDEGGDFIIDALAVREHIHKLNLAFTNPKILKIFHGADMDVMWLQRDFGVYIVGLFDTHQAARILKVSNGYSLKNLLIKYCQVDTDKKYQLADWRIRPLPEELVEYARVDTHYLLYIWRKMKQDLLNQADGQTHLLLNVFEKSRQICATTYNKEVIDDRSHLPLYIHSKKSFNSRQLAALKMLYKWRDTHARELDESASYILPNNMLLSLAEHLPREVQGVHACCNPMPPVVKQHLITLHRMILSCRELPIEPTLYEMPASISTMVNQAQQMAHTFQIHDLSQYKDYADHNINLDLATRFARELQYFQPDINVFVSPYERGQPIVSDLNVEAKLFIPPYDRYRKYRALAQMEEMKEYKEKEAKIAAISKDNQLIKQEVLAPIQHAKEIAEEEIVCTKSIKEVTESKEVNSSNTHNNQKQRKRKISSEKLDKDAELHDNSNKDMFKQKNNKLNTVDSNVKTYSYKNANYKKFLDVDKLQKQTKPKLKHQNK